jgi:hypothetical protein
VSSGIGIYSSPSHKTVSNDPADPDEVALTLTPHEMLEVFIGKSDRIVRQQHAGGKIRAKIPHVVFI